jgi:chemotaxis family two-component system sensor kinase Cph1
MVKIPSKLATDYWSSDAVLAKIARESEYYAKLFIDREGKLAYTNRGACRLLGYTNEELVGKDVCIFFTPEDKELDVAQIELKTAIKNGFAEDDRWHLRKDGSRFWATGVMTAVRDSEENLLGFCKEFRDTTLRKKTEDEIRYENSRLSHFTAIAAHDLQQPLRTMNTYIKLLQTKNKGVLTEDSMKLIDTASSACVHMSKLVKDLLLFGKLGSEHKQVCELVDFNAAFDVAVANVKTAMDENGAQVTRTLLPRLSSIASQVEQLFQNLISNAIKYRSDEIPRVMVDVTRQADHWVFSVKDNGRGIDPRDHQRIFETFERLNPRDSETEVGTGLGLSICRLIVEQRGGKIWVESEMGKGAVFYFTVPLE